MDDKKWEKLFELISEVINIDGVSAGERGDLIVAKAREFGGDADNMLNDLGEFVAVLEGKID